MKTNIVMLVHGRVRLTNQALRTLFENTDGDTYTLTLIDDASQGTEMSDVISMWVRTFNNAYKNVSLLRVFPHVGVTGRVRNLGVEWSRQQFGEGDWLYLSDNDVYFTPGWLDTLTDVLVGPPHACVLGGWNHPYLKPYMPVSPPFPVLHTHDAVTGASQLMKWSTWNEFGPLDAHAKGVGQSEDWAFCQKVVKAGGRTASIYLRVVLNCGITNSYGQPSTGSDDMRKDLEAAKVLYPDLYWE